jgi:hypothetical protein
MSIGPLKIMNSRSDHSSSHIIESGNGKETVMDNDVREVESQHPGVTDERKTEHKGTLEVGRPISILRRWPCSNLQSP